MREGQLLAGRFELERLARSGGSGSVYRALDRQHGVPVALKIMHRDGSIDADRFRREAQLLSQLGHPAIVRYVAHGRTPDGDTWLALEWLEGQDLGERLADQGRLDVREALVVGTRLAEAIGVAHARGVVHRDVKPNNVFLPEGDLDRAKILDFGIAGFTRATRRLTKTGIPVGTPGYMAPEQARGESVVDARSDVFALGCLLFECLAGKPAFVGEHWMAVLAKILFEEAPPLKEVRPEVPSALSALVSRMLAKEPGARPADGEEVARQLAAVGEQPENRNIESTRPPALTRHEQRLVSVVVAGTRARIDDREPTMAADDASRRLTAVRPAVQPYEAQVEALADGTVLAMMSGTGLPTELAVRAARCAVSLKEALSDPRLVLATGMGMMADRLPVGEVIDRAVASLDDARPDGIVVDDATASLVHARFDVVREEGVTLLREEHPGPAAGARTLLGKPSPWVGRQREVGLLEATWEACIGEPAACAVLVTGAAGVGKSRLRQEFVSRVRERHGEEVGVVVARGDPMGAGGAFAMVGPAIRRLAGIAGGEPRETQRQLLRDWLGRLFDGEELDRTAEFLGELAGVRFPADDSVPLQAARADVRLMGDRMRAAWLRWLEAECRRGPGAGDEDGGRPMLLVLEDLHWGDLPTVQLVDDVLRSQKDVPLMVLALGRPEVHDRFPDLWSGRDVTEIRLAGLSRKAATDLVRRTLGEDTPEPVVERLVVQAEGNAFFLEELIRAQAEGRGEELPPTLLGMVQARLDALDPEARRVLRAASILGRRFREDGVAALVGGPERDTSVREWLAELGNREILRLREQRGPEGERRYVFRHDLVREAAYAMLTDADRSLGHRLAGQWLEAHGERDAVALAQHFERGGEHRRAARWYRCAAEDAFEGDALDEAVSHAEHALACGAAAEDRGRVQLLLAEARRWKDEVVQAEGHALEAVQALPRGGAAWFRALGEVLCLSGLAGHHDRMLQWVDDLELTEALDVDAGRQRWLAACRVAWQLVTVGRYALADRLAALVDPSGAAGDPVVAARLARVRALRYLYAGDLPGTLAEIHAAQEAFGQADDRRNACLEEMREAHVWIELGRVGHAEQVLRESLGDAEAMRLSYPTEFARVQLAVALGRGGQLDKAREVGEGAVGWLAKRGGVRHEGMARLYLAEILLAARDLELAEEQAWRAASILEPFTPRHAHALALLAEVHLERGDTQRAVEESRQAMVLLESLGAVPEGETRIRCVHARTLAAAGDEGTAKGVLKEAIARLVERASRLEDDALRESFLATPDARAVLELADRWGLPRPDVADAAHADTEPPG